MGSVPVNSKSPEYSSGPDGAITRTTTTTLPNGTVETSSTTSFPDDSSVYRTTETTSSGASRTATYDSRTSTATVEIRDKDGNILSQGTRSTDADGNVIKTGDYDFDADSKDGPFDDSDLPQHDQPSSEDTTEQPSEDDPGETDTKCDASCKIFAFLKGLVIGVLTGALFAAVAAAFPVAATVLGGIGLVLGAYHLWNTWNTMSTEEAWELGGGFIGGFLGAGIWGMLRKPATVPPPTGPKPLPKPAPEPLPEPLPEPVPANGRPGPSEPGPVEPPPRQPGPGLRPNITVSELLGLAEQQGFPSARVLPGRNGKIAVIGRNMNDVVNPFAAELEKLGIEANTFSGTRIPPEAVAEWSQLKAAYAPERIPESVVRNSQMFKANQQWAQQLKDAGYTIIDLTPGPTNSPFYEMEQQLIFGGF